MGNGVEEESQTSRAVPVEGFLSSTKTTLSLRIHIGLRNMLTGNQGYTVAPRRCFEDDIGPLIALHY